MRGSVRGVTGVGGSFCECDPPAPRRGISFFFNVVTVFCLEGVNGEQGDIISLYSMPTNRLGGARRSARGGGRGGARKEM